MCCAIMTIWSMTDNHEYLTVTNLAILSIGIYAYEWYSSISYRKPKHKEIKF